MVQLQPLLHPEGREEPEHEERHGLLHHLGCIRGIARERAQRDLDVSGSRGEELGPGIDTAREIGPPVIAHPDTNGRRDLQCGRITARVLPCLLDAIGPGFDRDIGYGPVYEHEQALLAASPIRHVRHMTAPMLMLQGEADRICPLDDTWQLFVALRELGRDVEMVLYPDEHHVMMATARPDRPPNAYSTRRWCAGSCSWA